MQKINYRAQTLKYFYWFAFIGTLFVIGEMLRLWTDYQQFKFLDIIATSAFLNIIIIFTAIVLAIVLISIIWILNHYNLDKPREISDSLVFALFLSCFLYLIFLSLSTLAYGSLKLLEDEFKSLHSFINVLRHSTMEYGIPARQLMRSIILWGSIIAALCGIGISIYYLVRFSNWATILIGERSKALRIATLIIVIISFVLSGYLVLEPLKKLVPAPVDFTESKESEPNVIIFVLDALTSRDMSLYGYKLLTTPNIDRWASNWTVYENAHSTGNASISIIPAILLGRYPYFDSWPHYGELVRNGKGWMNFLQILQSIGYEINICSIFPLNLFHLHYLFDVNLPSG